MISQEELKKRRELLLDLLSRNEDMLLEYKERIKHLKQEISNAKGAVAEIEKWLDKKD